MTVITKIFSVLCDSYIDGKCEAIYFTNVAETRWIEANINYVTQIADRKQDYTEKPYFEINDVVIGTEEEELTLEEFSTQFKIDAEDIYDNLLESLKILNMKKVDYDDQVLIYAPNSREQNVKIEKSFAKELFNSKTIGSVKIIAYIVGKEVFLTDSMMKYKSLDRKPTSSCMEDYCKMFAIDVEKVKQEIINLVSEKINQNEECPKTILLEKK